MKRWLLLLLWCGCPKPPDDRAVADGEYLAGTAAFLKGQFAEAHQHFAEVKKLNPLDPRLPAAEGEVFLAEVKLPEAQAAFEEAAKLDAKRATNFSRLGFIHSLRGQRAEARAALEKALALNPRDFNAHESMAELFLKEGQVDAAVKEYLLASQSALEPNRAELVLKAAAPLAQRGQGGEALKVLEQAARDGVKGSPFFSELGDALAQAGRLDEASKAFRSAAEAGRDDPSLWELVGEVELKVGRAVEAEEAFRKSLEVKDRAVVHVALARLCLERHASDCLKAELDRALATASGEELRETLELAALLEKVDRKRDALTLLKAAAEEEEQKHNPQLQRSVARLAMQLGDLKTAKAACLAADAGLKCP